MVAYRGNDDGTGTDDHEDKSVTADSDWIARGESLVTSCPRSQPVRAHLLYILSVGKFRNYDKEAHSAFYLDDIVLPLTEVVLLRPRILYASTIGPAFYLACALLLRFDRKKLRILLHLPLRGSGVQFSAVVTELIDALSKEIKLNREKEQANIEEMLALYPRLLPWGPPSKDIAHVLSIIARTAYRRSYRTGRSDYLEQLVELLREARKFCQPKDHPELSIDLAGLLMLLRQLEPSYTLLLSDMFQCAAGRRGVIMCEL